MKYGSLIKFIEGCVPISQVDIGLIEHYFESVTVAKDVLLEKENKIAGYLYFINSGYLRVFHVEDGIEITTHINCPLSLITSFTSFITATPGRENVETIARCELLRISKENHTKLYKHSQPWVEFCRKIYERSLIFNEQRVKDMLTLSAEKRYAKLMSNEPEIIRNVPLQYIASYIGIKPESLSRIRRQITS